MEGSCVRLVLVCRRRLPSSGVPWLMYTLLSVRTTCPDREVQPTA